MSILVAITTRVSYRRNYRIRLPHIHKRMLYLSTEEHKLWSILLQTSPIMVAMVTEFVLLSFA